MRATTSLCPDCLRRLPAVETRRGDEVWLERMCPEHGKASALIWRGPPDYDAWRAAGSPVSCCEPPENPACPEACGLCAGHARQTCCVLLEVTQRCDIECPVCYAGARTWGPADPSLETIGGWLRYLHEATPGCNVQLSGGEPCVRDDLPEVVALARSFGHDFIQLNTNGLRLSSEDGYAEQLSAAGLSTVFLQFDGVDDGPYRALRGRPLAAAKERAVERCTAAGLGVVLVPTVARGINVDRLGDILDFALRHSPGVRGIHLQPLALFGRYAASVDSGAQRVTLPDAMRALADQSHGLIALDDLTPGDCEHALCSFSREYLRRDDGSLAPLGTPAGGGCDCDATARPARRPPLTPTDKAAHVAARWSTRTEPSTCCGAPRAGDDQWTTILRQIRDATFSVSGMAFMDAWTIDLDRLRHCYLHVLAEEGRLVPFCAFNLTARGGRQLPGGRHTGGKADTDPAAPSSPEPAGAPQP